MAREDPTSSEEYIKQVQQQAEEQSDEHVESHEEIKKRFDSERQFYR